MCVRVSVVICRERIDSDDTIQTKLNREYEIAATQLILDYCAVNDCIHTAYTACDARLAFRIVVILCGRASRGNI